MANPSARGRKDDPAPPGRNLPMAPKRIDPTAQAEPDAHVAQRPRSRAELDVPDVLVAEWPRPVRNTFDGMFTGATPEEFHVVR